MSNVSEACKKRANVCFFLPPHQIVFLRNVTRSQITLVCVCACYLAAVPPNTYLSRWQRQLMLAVPFLFFAYYNCDFAVLWKRSLCHMTQLTERLNTVVFNSCILQLCACVCAWYGTRSQKGFNQVHFQSVPSMNFCTIYIKGSGL